VRKADVQPLALSAADLAAMLSISRRQVWAMHQAGSLGPAPVPLSERLRRWDRAEVEEWWAACRAAGRRIGRKEWLRMQQDERPH